MSKQAFLATVLSDLVTTGHAILADGTEITVTDFGDWFQMVKFLHTHIDGPTTNEANQINNVAIYKVYAGVDVDKV